MFDLVIEDSPERTDVEPPSVDEAGLVLAGGVAKRII
jgi:hypothetical protein